MIHTGVHQDGGQDLEALAENLGITDCVQAVDQYRYHGGLVQPSDLNDWYGALDVLSCCSYGEGFGLPIMEAQACWVPVITTRASSMEELNPLGYPGGRGAVLERRSQGVVGEAVDLRRWWPRLSGPMRSGTRWTGTRSGRSLRSTRWMWWRTGS